MTRQSVRSRLAASESDWWIAGVFCLAGLLLASLVVRIDQSLDLEPTNDRLWLYGGDATGASSVLSAIAASSITVAGVVFSANFVAMQLASSLYTPRVIWTLIRRRWLQIVLGTFLATFVFSLMVLRSVRSETEQHPEFTPVIGVSVAILFALMSVAVLVYYVHRGSKMVQPAAVIKNAATESFRLLESGFASVRREPYVRSSEPFEPEGVGVDVKATQSGYIQRLDGAPIVGLDRDSRCWIRLERLVGEFVLEGETLAMVYPSSAFDDSVASAIIATFEFGDERTPEQDVEYGFRRVADIALKALSPAINDPTTAMTCIDTLGKLMIELGSSPVASAGDGQRLFHWRVGNIAIGWDSRFFERCVDVAFTQIRSYGAHDAVVMAYLVETLRRLEALVPSAHRAVLREEAKRARANALAAIAHPDDRLRVEQAARWLDESSRAA
jgi:uncharacterized membrane protein